MWYLMGENIILYMDFKGKNLIDFLLIPAIVVLVGVAGFGLGRLSSLKESTPGVVIHSAADASAETNGTHDQTH